MGAAITRLRKKKKKEGRRTGAGPMETRLETNSPLTRLFLHALSAPSRSGPIECGERDVAPPLASNSRLLPGWNCCRTTVPSVLQGARQGGLEEALTGGGAPESAPACSLSSVNQNNDCASGFPGARRRTVSSRRRESGGRRSLGRAVSTLASGAFSADPAQRPQPARSRGAPALQPLLGSCALL